MSFELITINSMAILENNGLSFEISPTSYESGFMDYEFYFCWKGIPIIDENVLSPCEECPEGSLSASDDILGNCSGKVENIAEPLSKFICNVLNKNEMGYYEFAYPDLKLAIYPGQYFPFIGQSPVNMDDLEQDLHYTVMPFFNTHNFNDTSVYCAQGVSINLIVNDKVLEKFAYELETEFWQILNKIPKENWDD